MIYDNKILNNFDVDKFKIEKTRIILSKLWSILIGATFNTFSKPLD